MNGLNTENARNGNVYDLWSVWSGESLDELESEPEEAKRPDEAVWLGHTFGVNEVWSDSIARSIPIWSDPGACTGSSLGINFGSSYDKGYEPLCTRMG